MLFHCAGLSDLRRELTLVLLEAMPPAMVLELNTMTDYQKTNFVLGGLNSAYIPEWDNIYSAIGTFVHDMYTERQRVVAELLQLT